MKSNIGVKGQRRGKFRLHFQKMMECLCSGEQSRLTIEMVPSTGALAIDDYSSKDGEAEQKQDIRNIEEAELSLRERGSLNYEEARALLGRIEYQKGNIEAALHVFEGIDITALTPKIKISLAGRVDRKRNLQPFATLPMSMHAVSLVLEAIFLKAKSLQHLGSFKEAAQSCKTILDIVESSLPEGLPETFPADCKLQETLSKAIESLPGLWKLANSPSEAIMSYRRALLHKWNLEAQTTARIQKEFAILLLYGGHEASPPDLRSQMDSSFVPRNNMEEAILLLMILLRKVSQKIVDWDASILEHLCFALSVSSNTKALVKKVEELLPEFIDRREGYYTLALGYYGAGKETDALNLLQKLLHPKEDPKCVPALLMASRICADNLDLSGDGVSYSRRALESLESDCDQFEALANYLLGVSLSSHSKLAVSDSERISRQSEALQALEAAATKTKMRDPDILYHLSLENAEQRKLDVALHYAKHFLKLENGSDTRGWLLIARILSAQKRFIDAENILNTALDQTGIWDQGELLRTKAKLQFAQGQLGEAVETYKHLLAILQVQNKSYGSSKNLCKGKGNSSRRLDLEVWHDLASVYISLSRWSDAEVCLSKSKAISYFSAARFHTTGLLYERKGLYKKALLAYTSALDIDPNHVPSLVSMAVVLRQLGDQSNPVARSSLMAALRLDKMNSSAWHNLGLLFTDKGTESSKVEAADCFQAAIALKDSAPVEPFR